MNQTQVKNETTYEINGITYLISTNYSEGEETVYDKIGRLIQEDIKASEIT